MNTHRHLIRPLRLCLLALCLLAITAPPLHAQDAGLGLTLRGGLVVQQRQQSTAHDVHLRIEQRGGQWQTAAWTHVPGLSEVWHAGRVEKVDASDNRLELRVRIAYGQMLSHQSRSHLLTGGFIGGDVHYHIVLQRQQGQDDAEGQNNADNGNGHGTWTGSFTANAQASNTALIADDALRPARIDRRTRMRSSLFDRLLDISAIEDDAQRTAELLRAGFTCIALDAIKGRATAQAFDPAPRVRPAAAIEPGEHPRLLFRRADLPELRRRAATPEGQKIIAQLKELLARDEHGFRYHPPPAPAYGQGMWAAGHGLIYQLTGDRSQEQWSRYLVELCMYTPHAYGNQYGMPMFIEGVALAYDMWYDAWDEDFRTLVALYLERNVRESAQLQMRRDRLRMGDEHHFANPLPVGGGQRAHWNAHVRAAAGLAAMAILDDPVKLHKPISPADAITIAPADDYQPWVGVPVVPFTDNNMPRAWLLNGPFFIKGDMDPLKAIGGKANARPEPGTTVKYQGIDLPFRRFHPTNSNTEPDPLNPLFPAIYPRNDASAWSFTGQFGGFLASRSLERPDRDHRRVIYLYTVIDNDESRYIQALPNWGSHGVGTRMWVNGQELTDGDIARLERGRYPLMVEIDPGGGYANKAPRIAEYSFRQYLDDRKAYQQIKPIHTRANGALPEVEQHLEALAVSIRHYLTHVVDDDGWGESAGDGSYHQALSTVIPFVIAYRNRTGIDLAQGTGLQELLPVAARLAALDVDRYNPDSWHRAVAQSMPLMPEAYLPVARWYVDQFGYGMGRAHQAINLLANLPMDIQPRHPKQVFSRVGRYDRQGMHTISTAFDDPAGFIATIDRGMAPDGAQYASGNITLLGMGHRWLVNSGRRGAFTDRYEMNTTYAHGLFRHRGAVVSHEAIDEQPGVYILSMFSNKYRQGHVAQVEGRPRLYLDEDSRPDVAWRRSIAIDHSGTCGSPILVVIVDHYTEAAGVHKHNIMRTTVSRDRFEIDEKINGFVISQRRRGVRGGTPTTLVGRFVWPSRKDIHLSTRFYGDGGHVILVAESERPAVDPDLDLDQRMERSIADMRRIGNDVTDDRVLKMLEDEYRQLIAEDKARKQNVQQRPTGFFAVLTVQDGEAQAMHVQGEGLEAVVTLGNRVIRYDRERHVIVLEDKNP